MLQQLISGLEAGSWYALIGMAVVVIMKATDVPNFSMAEMGLVAAYVSWGLLDKMDHSGVRAFKVGIVPFTISIMVGLIVAFALGAVIERVLMRRFGGLSGLHVSTPGAFSSISSWSLPSFWLVVTSKDVMSSPPFPAP